MSHRYSTTFAERDQFVQLHAAGMTDRAIGDRMGWRPETVRKQRRRARRAGGSARPPQRPGPAPTGILSTFAPVVRWATLRIKCRHRAWGPAVVRDELYQRPSTRQLRLPSVSQLAAYFHQFGTRLIQPRRHLQLPPPLPLPDTGPVPTVFQLDMQERQHLPSLGYFNVLNLRAPAWGMTHSYPHPAGVRQWAHKVSLAEARDDCRHTFTVWGLPDAIQTDHDKVLVGTGEYPFPSLFTLWLIGLGVQHHLIARVIQNGSVERSHRTFDKQMLSGVECTDWSAFLTHVAAEQTRLNERLPSRAKACHGQVPLQAHPEALTPPHPYGRAQEAALFDMQRVYRYLAGGRWLRQTSTKGQFKFADRVWNAGSHAAHQEVWITFSLETHEFVVQSAEGQALKRLPSDWLTEAVIRGLSES